MYADFRPKANLMPGENPCQAMQTVPRHLLFVLLPDSWGQTVVVVVSCPVLVAQCPLKLGAAEGSGAETSRALASQL